MADYTRPTGWGFIRLPHARRLDTEIEEAIMHITDDPLWDELWHVVATVRDGYERLPNDCPTDEIVFEVFQVLSRRGLTGRPPTE